jgi:hypothetical protein
MNAKVLGVTAFLALVGFTFPASATIIEVTYTGTVSYGFDSTGVFGSPNTDLGGDAYKATYLFDTTLGYTLSNPAYNYALGGSEYPLPLPPPPAPVSTAPPVPSPSLGAVVIINGRSLAVVGSYYGVVLGVNNGPGIFSQGPGIFSQADAYAEDFSANALTFSDKSIQNYIQNRTGTIPASITSSYTYTVGPNDSAGGFIYDVVYSKILGQYSTGTYAYLDPATLTYSVVSDVPEPATFALVCVGLLGLIVLLRKRRSASVDPDRTFAP